MFQQDKNKAATDNQPPTKTVDELEEEAKERVPYILMKFNRYKP